MVALDVETKQNRTLAEVSFWPIGWILTFRDQKVTEALEITHWLDYEFIDKRDMLVSLPCNYKVTMYPADFRTPEQVTEAIDGGRRQEKLLGIGRR